MRCLVLLTILFRPALSLLDASWWSSVAQLSTSLAGQSARPVCSLRGLSPGQARICDLFKDHMPAVGQGAQTAIQECQYQFKSNRWNCSTPYGSGIVGPVHKLGTREAAFTYAILSAGVTHEIGRRCRQGLLASCGCSEEAKPKNVADDWTWGGCGDNVDYGYRFSKNFIDIREKERDPRRDQDHGRSLMNRRNNEAGRKILKRHTAPKCKCHGVSGACNLKTCWMQLPTMRQVGNILQNKYKNAIRVQVNSRGNLQLVADQLPKDPGGRRKTRALPTDLVFMDDSPDYCRQDRAAGTLGTQGRICRRGSDGADGCDSLCCGRGYNTYTVEQTTKCNCKFEWCCKVVCQMCTNTTQVDICK
ncbi:hypothetical protein Y032_0052g2274 [Ancylostoma ceylanicum]|uniref:Protein Wnt n=1 Tax=Ancylostoma ceylanicum TaxID=53326 RepID=A0A016U7N3_9BILA|nr:hypothetical protein Y032_0052g2274 [Ancylostoma ceylanicum]